MKPDIGHAMVPEGASKGCYGNTEKEHLAHAYGDQEGFPGCPKGKWHHTGEKTSEKERFRQKAECVRRLVTV